MAMQDWMVAGCRGGAKACGEGGSGGMEGAMVRSVIGKQLERVRERVREAARRAGRDPAEVRLIAVSKSKPAQAVREAWEAGQRDFGENYVQELLGKAQELRELEGIRWHMIGHLQTNKVKQVLTVVQVVQTVDSERLAAELSRRARERGERLRVLIEVNVGGEEQKSGVTMGEAAKLVEVVKGQGGLELVGLMTVPPYELEAEEAGEYFERLRGLRDALGGREVLPELSMGMSHDFEVAIARGATMVRVGTSIFGERG